MRERTARLAARLGWMAVWILFALFNLFLITGNIGGLLRLTLLSLPPIWILTVIGGTVELRALMGHAAKERSDR